MIVNLPTSTDSVRGEYVRPFPLIKQYAGKRLYKISRLYTVHDEITVRFAIAKASREKTVNNLLEPLARRLIDWLRSDSEIFVNSSAFDLVLKTNFGR